jgi:hypothetical protein
MTTPRDPEQYIRDLEREAGQGPRHAAPFGRQFGGQFGGPGVEPMFAGRLGRLVKLANARSGRLILTGAGIAVFAVVAFVAHHAGKTTVHDDLIMINSGAKQTIECNNGHLKLDGDNNTYTVTGHCRRLEVFGSANRVTVDSADIISAFGDDNTMTYHSGYPTINKTGNNNTVSQRQAPVG